MKRDLMIVGCSLLSGGIGGYCTCLARSRIAGAFLVLAGKAEAKIVQKIEAEKSEIKAEVAKIVGGAGIAIAAPVVTQAQTVVPPATH